MKQALLELFRQKRGFLIIAGTLLLANAILITLINGYQESALSEAKRKWTDQRNRVAAVERGDVTAAYQQGKRDLDKLETMIPPKGQFPRLLGDILDAAASSGLTMGTVTYNPKAVKDENLLSYGMTMTVGGSYAAVKSFLADLQKNRELVVIDDIKLTNSDPFEEKVTMEVILTVYLREGA